MMTFHLPDLGEGLQEAEIVAWHVTIGDRVVADQPLISVETDKAVVEVPSPHSGHIAKLYGEAGDIVRVGEALVDFEETGADDAGSVVGRLGADSEVTVVQEAARTISGGVKALPAVRALARKLGIDLAVVAPTGPKGTITKADVERASQALAEAGPAEPIRGVRRAMAEKMARAHAEVVPATVTDEADVDAWAEDEDVTLRLMRAVARACAAVPALNAWFDGKKMTRRFNDKVDLGIAVNTRDGLFVPVLNDVGNRDPANLRAGIERMKADVKARKVPPEELRGQTITLSNFGMLAGRYSEMVVVPPQVAIIGAGRYEPRAVARGNKVVVRRILPLSITFDHRAVTGGEAAGFLAAMIEDLKSPS